MRKYLLTLLTLVAFSSAFAAPQNKLPKPKPTRTQITLPAFTAINVTGFVKVILKSSASKDAVIEARNPQWVSAKVRKHTLYLRALTAAKASRTPPRVIVRMSQINRLDVYGRASVSANNIKSSGLYLRSDTTGSINLNGMLTVDRINNYGPSSINIRWVKGPALSVRSLAGHIKLAGDVTELRVKLQNHAHLDAQYLRTKRILIQTKGFSTSKLMPLESLKAFANDFSNVYFYNLPEHISRYSSGSGNVLYIKK